MKGDGARYLSVGMDAYTSKPIRSTDLFATVERLLSIPDTLAATELEKT